MVLDITDVKAFDGLRALEKKAAVTVK